MELVLANLLLEHAPLVALIDDKIDWDQLPAGVAYPAVVMFLISAPVSYHLQGPSKLVPARVQFDCRGRSRAEAKQVADAVEARLSGFKGIYEDVAFGGIFKLSHRSGSDADAANGWFTASMDFQIWSKPA